MGGWAFLEASLVRTCARLWVDVETMRISLCGRVMMLVWGEAEREDVELVLRELKVICVYV